MVEAHCEYPDHLLFRDYLREYPEAAWEYAELKVSLAQVCRGGCLAYTKGKADLGARVTEIAKQHYRKD
jgi:GrpB-like predicted nucleotidyltransferase (UPF0157 family)